MKKRRTTMSTPRLAPAGKKRSAIYSDFEEAKARILKAIPQGPFYGLVTGPSGTGKTSLLREVAASCDRHRFQTYYLAHSQASSSGLGRFLADALHLGPRRFHTETLRSVGQTLRDLPLRLLLLIDEANLLAEETLQEVRLLAESELDSPPLFTVLLAGLPELKAKLEAPALFPLKRRLSLRVELNGLKKDEVAPFLALRLGEPVCGRLPEEVVMAIFERARGIPALVESLARLCLENGSEKEAVTLASVTEVLESWEVA